jgi:MFS family permease
MTVTSEAPTGRLRRVSSAWRSGPLSVPAFRLLTVGQFTSNVGDYFYAVALPWLVLSDHGDAASLGIVLACYGVPRAALMLPSGSLADRFGSRTMMLAADTVRCALTALFVVLAAGHVSSIAVLGPVAAVLGAAAATFMPASAAMMPSLVDDAQLTSANAIFTGFVQVGSILGPVLGGVLVATAGPAPAFAVDSGSYLVSAISLLFIGRVTARQAARETADETAVGETAGPAADDAEPATVGLWALLRRERILQILLVVVVAANFALTGTTEVTLPALAHERYGADGYGAVLTCIAVFSIIGALGVARVGDRFRPVTLVGSAFLVAAAAIAAAPFLGGLPGLAAGLAIFGLAIGFDQVVSVTLIQRWAPPAMLGRVWGLLLLASTGTFPLSTIIAGVLTRHLGPTPVFPICGAVLALAMLFGLAHREFREFGTDKQR